MPQYVNPADFFIKLAINPRLLHPTLTTIDLAKICNESYLEDQIKLNGTFNLGKPYNSKLSMIAEGREK